MEDVKVESIQNCSRVKWMENWKQLLFEGIFEGN